MSVYTDLQAVATNLIGDFGQSVVLTNISAGTHDPVTGAITSQATTTQTVNAVVFEYTLRDSGLQYGDGVQIEQGDKKVLISSADLTAAPTLKSKVTIAGTVWRVMNIKETSPGGVSVIYELQVRK